MKKILLATDGSSYSEDAARFLAHLPHDKELEIVVLSVLNVPATNRSSISRDWIDQGIQEQSERAEETFASIELMFEGANVKLRHVVEQGHVGSTIAVTARQERVELVVMGARGRSAVNRMLLGSVSDYVATHAPCSVLVVRPTGSRQRPRFLRIMVAYEPSASGDAAVEEISEIKWGSEPEIRVISIAHPTPSDNEEELHYVMTRASRAADRIREIASDAVAQVTESQHVGEALVSYTEEHNCDIVVVAESPRSRLGRILLGSVSRFVLRHAPCSVWITRNRMLAREGTPLLDE